MKFQSILVDTNNNVGIITLNRPKALNALNGQLLSEVAEALASYDSDDNIGSIIITGSQKAFAAGADIKEMATKSYAEMLKEDFFGDINRAFRKTRKPVIAAVSGYALGGGCELAMACDFIIAGDNARFGQPEINLGVIPGIGGSQRLTKLVGKSKSMDMILTGRMMDAEEAERSGLVSRVVPADDLIEETVKIAESIADKSLPSVILAKEVVNYALESGLEDGLQFERRVFHSLFATEDQKEGMAAFSEKRSPKFKNK